MSTRLTLRDIRAHRGTRELDLARGLTVIRGPNEAGKSTILRALELALTRRVTSTATDLDGLRTWGAPEDRRPEVALDFVLRGRGRRADRPAREGVPRGRGTVRLEIDGEETLTDPAAADERLAELTGIPSEASPGHGLRPPPRARSHREGRGGAARSTPGVDQRRRSRHLPGEAAARAGAPRARAAGPEAPRPVEVHGGAPGHGWAGWRTARRRWRACERIAMRSRCRATHRRVWMRSLAEARAMLDKARIAERLSPSAGVRRTGTSGPARRSTSAEIELEADPLVDGCLAGASSVGPAAAHPDRRVP